jgi:glutamate/tyrosine decarboxylase-like PLP-dependent enzyme
MNVSALDAALADDRSRHITPIAVVASAGTTNTGAIDDLRAIAAVCRRHETWLHADAAYGGPAILAHEYRERLQGLGMADSVALDPHKWLFVPVEAGLVFVRDAVAMRSAFSLVPPYLRTDGSVTGVGGPPWFSEFGFQQTRGFRALKVWMAMKEFGLDGYKAAIEENIALARYLADCVRRSADLELTAPPGLSVVCFRVVGGLRDEEAIAALNRTVLERLQLGGEAFLSSTELRGRFTLRACIVNYRSTGSDIDRMLETIRRMADEATAVRTGV